jgi:3-oxoacyl-[acyl-carrier protein] reductase
MEKLLKDKVCVVTGASRGIGAAIAARFLAEGASVYAFSRTAPAGIAPAPATQASAADPAPGSTTPRWIQCDVADEASIEAAIAAVLAEAGRIDVLVNNAGITRDGLLMRMKTEDWDAVLDTNLKSAFLLSRAVVRPMLKQRSGCILNVSSVVGITGNGGQANYSASKAGIIGFTKSLAREVASRDIRVNAIAPGFIETSMTDRIPEDFKQKLKESIPLGRVGTTEEAANAALFLCSPLASYCTGIVLQVDGGMGM